jgi:hypothetical protein
MLIKTHSSAHQFLPQHRAARLSSMNVPPASAAREWAKAAKEPLNDDHYRTEHI